jgi:Ca2+/Na+ antiporter
MSGPEVSNRQSRTGESRVRLWILLDAHRMTIAGGMALAVFCGLVVLGALDPTPLRTIMRGGDPTDTAFQALIGGVITSVTLIISIAQLSVSQELAAVGDQRERMASSLSLQEDIEDAAGAISGPSPGTYLGLLCAASRQQATALEEAVADNSDATLRERVDRFADRVIENADGIEAELTSAQFGEFAVVRAALNYNYSWKIYATRRLQIDHEDALSEEETAAFDRMGDVLELFGPAQEYFKTHYLQWEFVNLSRAIMYVAIPALTTAIAVLLYVDAGVFPGQTLGIDNMTWVVSATATFTVLPFFVFISYLLRIATISKRTGTTGPFILRDSERLDVFDW